jgi:hypothetical protein
MPSVGTMIKQISGLLGTKDLNEWENDFTSNIVDKTNYGNNTQNLTSKQIESVLRIFNKHFEG